MRVPLKQDADVNCLDERGRTPLVWAGSAGAEVAAQVPFAAGADASIQNARGMNAAEEGRFSLVQSLKNLVPPEK